MLLLELSPLALAYCIAVLLLNFTLRGSLGFGGAMATIFFAMFMGAGRMGKDAFRATMSAMILTISIARTAGYAAVGELTLDAVVLCAATIPAMGIGLLVGDRLHTGLSPTAFQRLVCILLTLCGIALLGSGPEF